MPTAKHQVLLFSQFLGTAIYFARVYISIWTRRNKIFTKIHGQTKGTERIPVQVVIYVVICILLENIAFFCLAGSLNQYLEMELREARPKAKTFFYTFILLTYAFALLGGLLADACFSRKYVIIFALCAYTLFFMCITICSKNYELGKKESLHLFKIRKFAQCFFLLMATFANGLFRPNIITLAGDQFELPEQGVKFGGIVALVYFIFKLQNFGFAVNNISCIFHRKCYTGYFGTLTAFLFISLVWKIELAAFLVIFLWNLGQCRKRKVEKGFVWNLITSIFHPAQDHSRHSYERRIARHGKRTLRILRIFLPLPVFYQFFQLSERWPQSSYRMASGMEGFYSHINPTVMKGIKAGITMFLIPVFYCLIYPVLSPKVRLLRRPLRRMICGGFTAVLALFISGILYLRIESYDPQLPAVGEAHLRIYDSTNCEYRFWSTNHNIPSDIEISEYYVNKRITAAAMPKETNFTFKSNRSCEEKHFTVDLKQKEAYGLFLTDNDINLFIDFVRRSKDGQPLVRTIISNENYSIVEYRHTVKPNITRYLSIGDLVKFPVGIYTVLVLPWSRIEVDNGATYTVLINMKQRKLRPIIVTDPNKVHILWQIPQYIVIGAAEVMFWISGLEFAYSEASESAKALILGLFIFFSYFLGTGIYILVEEKLPLFEKESTNFFIFASLLLVTCVIFVFLVRNYKYASDDDEE